MAEIETQALNKSDHLFTKVQNLFDHFVFLFLFTNLYNIGLLEWKYLCFRGTPLPYNTNHLSFTTVHSPLFFTVHSDEITYFRGGERVEGKNMYKAIFILNKFLL